MHLHEILDAEFKIFGNEPLRILETGTIRGDNEPSRIGDGWSTVWFAERVKRCGGALRSIDLDCAVVNGMLKERVLNVGVTLIEGHSIDQLALLCRDHPEWDVIFLDSDNDAQLILHEFMIARQLIVSGGLIIIDDVRQPHQPVGAFKGDHVWPYIQKLGLSHHVVEREGWNGYRTGVLTVQM